MISNINDRINLIIEKCFHGNVSEFCRVAEVKQATMSNIVGGRRSKPSFEVIYSIANNVPNISLGWLISGQGEMLKDADPIYQSLTVSKPGDQPEYVYLLPVSAHGGTLSQFVSTIKEKDCERIISPIRDADFAITVLGDSMAPEYPNGSQILIKRINEKAFIDWGKAYVLDTCNGVVIKRIFPPEEKNSGCLKCVSINPEYPPFEINMRDVFGMYRVMLCMAPK